VGELTWPDQEFIETMQRKLHESEKHHRTLIVVHNFYDISNEEDLLDMWRSCVVSTVKGIVQSESLYEHDFPAIYFKQQMNSDSEMPTIHVFLAKENTEAGKLWNNITYNYLRGRISKADIPKKDTLHNLLVTKAKEVLKLYTRNPENVTLSWKKEVPIRMEKIHMNPKKSQFGSIERITKDEWMTELVTIPEPPPGHFLLKCTGDISLTHSVDFDGFRILFTRKTEVFQPKFDVLQTEKGLLVMMDIPGVDWKKDIKVRVSRKDPDYPEKIVLIISGARRLYYREIPKDQERVYEQYEKALCPKLKRYTGTDRLCGTFTVVVVIPTEIDDNPRNAVVDYVDGILRVVLPKKDDDGDLITDE